MGAAVEYRYGMFARCVRSGGKGVKERPRLTGNPFVWREKKAPQRSACLGRYGSTLWARAMRAQPFPKEVHAMRLGRRILERRPCFPAARATKIAFLSQVPLRLSCRSGCVFPAFPLLFSLSLSFHLCPFPTVHSKYLYPCSRCLPSSRMSRRCCCASRSAPPRPALDGV